MQLADDDALGAVDDESALGRHERQFAHVHALFLDVLVFAQAEGDVEGSGEGLAFALAFQRAELGLTDFVIGELELDLFVVAFDGEDFGEDGLEAFVLALGKRNVFLEKIGVAVELNFNQVGGLDGLGQTPEIHPLSRGASQCDGVIRLVKLNLLAVNDCHGCLPFLESSVGVSVRNQPVLQVALLRRTAREGTFFKPSCLLDFDLGASRFKLLLDVVGFFLRHAFADGLGGTFNKGLRFGQAEAGDRCADFLDDADLVRADFSQNDVERRLGFSHRGRRRAAASRSRSRDRSRCADAELGFEKLHEFGGFQERQSADVVYQSI